MNSITILHYDDEIDTVAPIAVSILNYYFLHAPTWVNESDVVFDDFLRHFQICPPGKSSLLVNFLHEDTVDKCRIDILGLKQFDIAFFDLMLETNDGHIELVGIDLYKEAKTKMPEERIFFMTGFPHKLSDAGFRINTKQLIVKPISPTEVAAIIIGLFPIAYRPQGQS